ncbi:MAG: hypothetical protein CFE34_14540 [Rhodobacteraceae bacterium PARR1]|nr:MAG: hypothetical protein CFE34_14540 [Rhodobacteraceae bacterium PARR1]
MFKDRIDRAEPTPARDALRMSRVLAATLMLSMPLSMQPLQAQTTSPQTSESVHLADTGVLALADAMQIKKIIAVMREEGLDYAKTLQEDMFPGAGNRGWIAEVEGIYDPDRMSREFEAALSLALAGNPGLEAMTDFMGGVFGNRVIGLELAARKALLDPAAEDAARVAWLKLEDEDGTRAQQIERFVAVNDLLDSNVTGAMNSNIAFYRGLMAAAPAGMDMTEDDILASVSDQQAQIEADTADWLYPYLTLAYQPLTDAELDDYVAFSESAPGKDMNRALFAAFAAMFDRLSYDLGVAAGRRMQGQDI